jgi:ATP-dependent DNA ligase
VATPRRAGREGFGCGLGKLAVVLPRFEPMKAVTGQLPPGVDTDAWSSEVKWDGQLH